MSEHSLIFRNSTSRAELMSEHSLINSRDTKGYPELMSEHSLINSPTEKSDEELMSEHSLTNCLREIVKTDKTRKVVAVCSGEAARVHFATQ
jgi:hypothetical protein